MTNSPNLNIIHLEPNSASPEVPVDEAIDDFDAKITGSVVVAVDNTAAYTLTQDEQARGSIFMLSSASPGPAGAVTINFAAFGMGVFAVLNETGQTVTLRVTGQPVTPPTLLNNALGLFMSDGINVRKIV